MFFRLNLLIFLFSLLTLTAQDYGPVKVDLEGYVDDRKGEIHVDADTKATPEKPDNTTKKDPVVKKDPVKTTPTVKRPTNTRPTGPRTVKRVRPKNIRKVGMPTYRKESSMMLYIAIGGGLLVVIIIVAVVVIKKKKSPVRKSNDKRSLAEKITAHEETQMEASVIGEDGPAEAPVIPPRENTIKTSYDAGERFATETRVDERGRNPSGIIIDEDKYFAAADGQFVDEDLDTSES